MSNATLAALAVVIVLALAPAPDQCDQPVFARNNPGLCSPTGFPFPNFPQGGGGGGGGGILGGIGGILHKITGGLL